MTWTRRPLRGFVRILGQAKTVVAALCLITGSVMSSGVLSSALASAEPFGTMHALLEEGRYDLAVQVEGPRLITAFPEEAEAYYLYSRALYLVGQAAEARRQLDRALELGDEPRYRWLEALLEADAGRPQAAQERLARLFEEAPSYALAMDWGRVAWQAGDFDGAILAFSEAQATEEGRRQPWPYLNHARLLGYLGRFDEAVGVLQTAIDIVVEAEDAASGEAEVVVPHPAYVEALYLLGEAYEALDQREDARATYYAALLANPLHQPSRIALNRLEDEAP